MQLTLLFRSRPRLVAGALFALLAAGLTAQERSLDWILERYVHSMGGRAELNAINSVSISGTMVLPDGREASSR